MGLPNCVVSETDATDTAISAHNSKETLNPNTIPMAQLHTISSQERF